MEAFSFVGFGTCAVCRVSQSWGDAIVSALAAVTSASGSSFGDSGVSGMQFLMGFVPPDYQRVGGSPKELGGKLPGHGISVKTSREPVVTEIQGGLNGSTQHSTQTHTSLKTKSKSAWRGLDQLE